VAPRPLLPARVNSPGGKRFGSQRNLPQRHEGDQGIGDFTTLAKLAEVRDERGRP